MKTKKVKLKIMLCAIALGAVLAGVYGVGHFNSQAPLKTQSRFRDAPDFRLPDAEGKVHSLESFRGKVVILHFWASWCAPCIEEIPRWIELSSKFKERASKMQWIAISLDTNWKDVHKILPTSALAGAKILSLLELSGKLPDDYGTYQYPETYLLSPDLKVLFKWVGPQDWNSPETQGVIQKVVQSYEGQKSL